MKSHKHCSCKHEIKYCKCCDAVYCTKCGDEWKKNYWSYHWNYPSYSSGGYYLSSASTDTDNATGLQASSMACTHKGKK